MIRKTKVCIPAAETSSDLRFLVLYVSKHRLGWIGEKILEYWKIRTDSLCLMHWPKLLSHIFLLFFFLVVGILGTTYYSQFESTTPIFSHKTLKWHFSWSR